MRRHRCLHPSCCRPLAIEPVQDRPRVEAVGQRRASERWSASSPATSPSPASDPRRVGCYRTGSRRTAPGSLSRANSNLSPGEIPSRSRRSFGITTSPYGPTRPRLHQRDLNREDRRRRHRRGCSCSVPPKLCCLSWGGPWWFFGRWGRRRLDFDNSIIAELLRRTQNIGNESIYQLWRNIGISKR